MQLGLGLGLTRIGGGSSLARLLFSANEPGFTFEPWDITTLFQDRAGTTPVTAAGQSVGYRRDKSGRGNHQVAVSDAKRGVYGWMPKTGRRNLLTYTEDFSNAAWVKLNTGTASVPVVTTNAATDPNGELTADLIQLRLNSATDSSLSWIYQNMAVPSGATRTTSFYVKAASVGDVGKTIRLTGTIITTVTLTANWQRFSNSSLLVTGATISFGIRLRGNEGTSDSVDLHIWGGQVDDGSTATTYQRVASQYDVTEAGVPTCYYVQADGVDDAYVTPTITPNTDKAQVFAGMRKLNDAAIGSLIELSATTVTNNGSMQLAASGTGAAANYTMTSKGTVSSSAGYTDASIAAPVTNVITGIADISGDTSTLRVNGVQVAQATIDQGTGNFLAYPAYIYSRGGTTLPFNGLDFGHAVRFGPNLDAATIARVEALIARNTPEVTL